MKQYLPLVLCWFACNAQGTCARNADERDYPRSPVALRKEYPDEFYYFRTAEHYAIIVEPATLTRAMAEQVRSIGNPSDERLLQDLRNNVLSGPQKDLFALVLKDAMYFTRIEVVLTEILQRGEASVVDAYYLAHESRRFVPETIVVQISTSRHKSREFCTPDGELLLQITDEID